MRSIKIPINVVLETFLLDVGEICRAWNILILLLTWLCVLISLVGSDKCAEDTRLDKKWEEVWQKCKLSVAKMGNELLSSSSGCSIKFYKIVRYSSNLHQRYILIFDSNWWSLIFVLKKFWDVFIFILILAVKLTMCDVKYEYQRCQVNSRK